MSKMTQKRGITLVALIATIIVALILVAVTIRLTISGGLFKHAQDGLEETEIAMDDEREYTNIPTDLDTEGLMTEYTTKNVTNPYSNQDATDAWICSSSLTGWGEYTGNETEGVVARLYEVGEDEYHLVIEPVGDTGTMNNLIISEKEQSYKVASLDLSKLGEEFILAAAAAAQPTFPQAWQDVLNYRNNITKVIICNGITNISNSAFNNCIKLSSVIISSSVTNIEAGAFNGCTNLSSITIPNNLTTIGSNAFRFCHNLKSIKIPGTVTSIGNEAFYDCIGLANITIPCGLIDSIHNFSLKDLSNLKNLTIIPGNNSTSIGEEEFMGWTNIENVVVSEGITSIGTSAFRGCNHLTNITLPTSVTSIGSNAFTNCVFTSLTYKGTSTEWEIITKGSNWQGAVTTIQCSDIVVMVESAPAIESEKKK